ncbi:MAG: L-fucokinase [Bryobacteraceae bacterium]
MKEDQPTPSHVQPGDIRQRSYQAFLQGLAGNETGFAWWSAVVITAGSKAQAEIYRREIQRRSERGYLPRGVSWHVVSDPEGRHIGSGGATLGALQAIGKSDPAWWNRNRVLVIHAGGESRRLPEYSLTGKLFGVLPARTPWGENSTVFDETVALSTLWLERFSSGLAVSSGDVVLTFDAAGLEWDRPGVAGTAIRQPMEVGIRHGIYVLDERGRVYSFLQKPTPAEVRAAGGILPGGVSSHDRVALDTGLLHFDAELSASLTHLASTLPEIPFLDLYQQFTLSLTGEALCGLPELAALLHGVPFHCSLVEGTFTHVGTTSHFRRLFQGGVVDSILAPGSELGPGALVIECHSTQPIRVGAGAIAHGLTDSAGSITVADETVVHQIPVILPDGRRGFVIRAYGVEDDPKTPTWFGRPISEVLKTLDLDPEEVWPGIPPDERCLWNAQLFLFDDHAPPRLSMASSTAWADREALVEARDRRRNANWRASAVALARSETDVRPLLIHAPGINALAETGRALSTEAAGIEAGAPSEAASRHFQASLFYDQAGLAGESARARSAAFSAVHKAVAGRTPASFRTNGRQGAASASPVQISAPARIDFGGGWSDTPPFCLDWGGTVFNMAITVNGAYPIRTIVRRIEEPVVRLVSSEAAESLTAESFSSAADVGSPFAIHRAALEMLGFVRSGEPMDGLEIRTEVSLPVGSGLGTSSILAATALKALLSMRGEEVTVQELSDLVLALEQFMTTGGGWQDQAGGIYPGAKLTMTGPGPRQRLRVEPVPCPAGFAERFVFYYTGIRRIAKDLLGQVVGRYLAREVKTVQVLHSIKTLAMEMAYAMKESDWDYLGSLLDRHWQLNQILDPHTTNAPINALLERVRPYVSGAKLAGAGGGGFLMLLARTPDHAADLRRLLESLPGPGALYEWAVAPLGLH